MLVTITTNHRPATDLGYLLHKHPDKFQSFELAHGQAHVFYPEANESSCTIALLLEIDPIDLVRSASKRGNAGFSLGHYVNDRPFAASSFLSVALSKAFSTAMNGKCKDRPELVDQKLPLQISISALPAPNGGARLIRALFEPLGYQVQADRQVLDPQFPAWGDSKYFKLTLQHTIELKHALTHLYVLIPALDSNKHYFVSDSEVEKLLERGKGWLEKHPEKEQITRRYLINLRGLARNALDSLVENEATVEEEHNEADPKQKVYKSLHQKRLELVAEKLQESGAKRIVDLGCGEGKLLRMLLKEKQFTTILGMDVSYRELLLAKDRLHWDEMAPRQRERIELIQGSLTYRDKRLEGYDAAAIVEVIEHMEPNRLPDFERVVFECAKPNTVVLTTPNSEYNVLFENMEADTMRHNDHRFEWSRTEFEIWATGVAERNNYKVEFFPVGEEAEGVGAPSQMGIFTHGD